MRNQRCDTRGIPSPAAGLYRLSSHVSRNLHTLRCDSSSTRSTPMTPKNTICCGSTWIRRRRRAFTRPPSRTARSKPCTRRPAISRRQERRRAHGRVHRFGIPCLGLNGGPTFKQSEAFSFQIATDNQEETDRYWNAIVGNGGKESDAAGAKTGGACPGKSRRAYSPRPWPPAATKQNAPSRR